MNIPEIKKEKLIDCFESKFLNVYDLNYAPGRHYYDASRHGKDDLVAIKSEDDFKCMLPDAVTCFVIIKTPGDEPKLLLEREFRYPCGRFLSGPPAGLLDATDKDSQCPQIATAKREIFEETGIKVTERDKIFVVNPLAFSTPGMTDESNALVCAVLEREDLSSLTTEGAEGSECFEGLFLLTKEDAKRYLKNGKDDRGYFYSMYTWAAMMYFVSDMWQ